MCFCILTSDVSSISCNNSLYNKSKDDKKDKLFCNLEMGLLARKLKTICSF